MTFEEKPCVCVFHRGPRVASREPWQSPGRGGGRLSHLGTGQAIPSGAMWGRDLVESVDLPWSHPRQELGAMISTLVIWR